MTSQPLRDAPPGYADGEHGRSRSVSELQRLLEDAEATIRRLKRELGKEQARHAETAEAYTKTVSNMVAVARENAILSHELERLKRTTKSSGGLLGGAGLPIELTPAEASVIRKVMARLHHPDVGGDEQRMKQWNVVLDCYETGE